MPLAPRTHRPRGPVLVVCVCLPFFCFIFFFLFFFHFVFPCYLISCDFDRHEMNIKGFLIVLVWLQPATKKRHAAAPPPAGVRSRMERNRQNLVGRDKGSLTEQQREGTATTTIQMRRKHNTNCTTHRAVLPDRRRVLPRRK